MSRNDRSAEDGKRLLVRLMSAFLLLSALPLAGLAGLHLLAFEQSLRETTLLNLSSIADKKVDQIDAYLNERLTDSRVLAMATATREAMRTSAGLAQGRSTSDSAVASFRADLQALFDAGDYEDLMLVDTSGNLLFSFPREADPGTNPFSGQDGDTQLARAYREAIALSEGQTTPAALHTASDGQPVILLVSPVLAAGQLLGTLVLRLDLDNLIAVASDTTSLGQTGETVLAQADQGQALYIGPLRHRQDAALHPRMALERTPPTTQAALEGTHGSGLTWDYALNEVAAAWRHLPALGWGMVVKMDAQEALAPARRLRDDSLTTLALFLLLAGTAAFWFGRSLSHPIQRLAAATRRIAAGDLGERAAIAGCRELRGLATSFNRMADRLAEEQTRLEERVTERTRALRESQSRYEESERNLERAQKVARIGSWHLDLAGHRLEWSEETYRIFGVDARTPLSYEVFLKCVHPDDRASVDAAWRATLKGAEYAIDHRILVGDGTKWVREQAELLFDTEGRLWAGIGTVQDITAQVMTDQALRASEERLRSIFERANAGIAFTDREGNLIKVNACFAKLVEYRLEELRGMNFACFTHPDDLAIEVGLLDEIEEGARDEYRLEKRYLTKSGKLLWVDIAASAVRDQRGTPINFVGLVVDITERKRAEQALAEQHEQLARSNAELEQCAYIASHDLRQPLRMVNSYVQLLQRRLDPHLDEETRQMMGFVTEGAVRMDQMLVSLLEYSRVGRMDEPLAPIESRGAIEEALRFLGPAIAEAQAEIRLEGDWPRVLANRNELTRLFQNLIGNAIKYRARERRPLVTLSVASNAEFWQFCVEDNGIGIDPTQFEHLFKLFQRLHGRETYEGTGIGLAVCRKILDRHGGRIWVESRGAGRGSRFRFTLQRAG